MENLKQKVSELIGQLNNICANLEGEEETIVAGFSCELDDIVEGHAFNGSSERGVLPLTAPNIISCIKDNEHFYSDLSEDTKHAVRSAISAFKQEIGMK